MIARGFKPVAWVAAIGTAALACYMLSLQVAAERAELAAIEGRIVQTRQSIRSLQTELGTRGRLQQLEQWNADVLALSAPVANQFLESNVSLARFDTQQRRFGDQAEVRIAAAEAAPVQPAPTQPNVRLVSAEARPSTVTAQPPRLLVRNAALSTGTAPAGTAPRQVAQSRPAATSIPASAELRPAVSPPRPGSAPSLMASSQVRPAATPSRPAAAPPRPAVVTPRQAAAQARPPAPAPARAPSLLDERTLRDLRTESRTERGGSSRN
jgi:hypothetical protein